MTSTAPSNELAPQCQAMQALYRQRAPIYDLELIPFEPLRLEAIARLGLKAGDTVLDVGCGTGLSFPLLQRAVGPSGSLIGIEPSADMLTQARQRVQRQGWTNVTLLDTCAASADIPGLADAALLHFTHDVMRDPAALAHLLAHLRPGARVVATGLKWAAPWLWPVNAFVLSAALYSVSSLEGMQAPWDLLALMLDDVDVRPTMMDGGYVASGVVRCAPGLEKQPARPI